MRDWLNTPLYHITEIANLAPILAEGALLSDARILQLPHAVIGYDHIKRRRLTEIRIACCANRFVGEFVPFYYCPRSIMLYTINRGNTGKPEGWQSEIVHLVTTVGRAVAIGADWALSDGNAGTFSVSFYRDLQRLASLDWEAIRARMWVGKTRQKAAEFLVADRFPWHSIQHIGCHNAEAVQRVRDALGACDNPTVSVEPGWYY